MKKVLILFIGFSLFYVSCFDQEDTTNTAVIRNLVERAISADNEANERLSGLIDLSMPIYTNYNQLTVDSIFSGDMLFFTVLLEYPNPAYNRFAVYDSELNLRLIDYSLNGNLQPESLQFANFSLYAVREQFSSKDLLHLERLKLYYIGKDTTSPALSTFLKLSSPESFMEREITEYNEYMIIMDNSADPSQRNLAPVDTFIFNDIFYRYITRGNTFDTLVHQKINRFTADLKKPEIRDPGSLALSLKQVGALDPVLFNTSYNLRLGKLLLYLPEGWTAREDRSIEEGILTLASGVRIENASRNGGFSIISLEESDSFDMYLSYPFECSIKKNFTLECTEPIFDNGRVIQYFGLHCNGNKYLILLTTSETVFRSQKHTFEYIINSFGMDCS